MLSDRAVKLISGFRHISGISIDKERGFLYAGAKVSKGFISSQPVLLKIPVNLLERCTGNPHSYAQAKLLADEMGMPIEEISIDGQPNGVRFTSEVNDGEVFYTCQKMFSFGKKGFIGSTSEGFENIHMVTPNGIDIDPSSQEFRLVVSQLRKNAITRVSRDVTDMEPYHDINKPKRFFGPQGKRTKIS